MHVLGTAIAKRAITAMIQRSHVVKVDGLTEAARGIATASADIHAPKENALLKARQDRVAPGTVIVATAIVVITEPAKWENGPTEAVHGTANVSAVTPAKIKNAYKRAEQIQNAHSIAIAVLDITVTTVLAKWENGLMEAARGIAIVSVAMNVKAENAKQRAQHIHKK
jgi:hypothetical protein